MHPAPCDQGDGGALCTLLTPSLRLSLQFKCCGSNSSADWQHSAYILSREAEGRRVPDSCCKTVVPRCGLRAHPSNIYKVEVSTLAPAGAYRGLSRPSRGPQKAGSDRQVGGSGVHLFIGQETTVQELHRSPQNPGDKQLLLGDSETSWRAPRSPKKPVGN